jgi:hypothetical protein
MAIKHLLVAATAEDFLKKMGEMYDGRRPIVSRDCRSTVVQYLKTPEAHLVHQLVILGFKGNVDVVHVLGTDNHGRIIVDALGGYFDTEGLYRTDKGTAWDIPLDVMRRLDVKEFFSKYTGSK